MLNNFIFARKKSLFTSELEKGNILDEAIVFIEDTKEIWNHGTYFDCSTVDLSNYITQDIFTNAITSTLNKEEAASIYQIKGDYALKQDLIKVEYKAENEQLLITFNYEQH